MEAKAIKSSLPDVVTAISDIVQPMSDQCLAKGLIPESVYKRVLESGGTSEDKARTLILAVKTSTETDSKCLEIFLKILGEQLPYGIRDKLLSKIRNEIAERTREDPKCTPPQSIPSDELAKESFALPNYLLGRFEKAVREHERSITEKRLLEDRLKAKPTGSDDGEREINDLKMKIEEIEKQMGKLDMQVRRDRIMVTTETQEWFTRLAKHHQQQTELAVRETEEAAQKKMEEQMRAKELGEIQERNHKLEKDSQVRELQANSKPPFDIDPPDRLKTFETRHYARTIESKLYFSIIRENFHKWRDLGSVLGFSKENMDKIESSIQEKALQHYSPGTPAYNNKLESLGSAYFKEMLHQWLDSYPGDSRGSNSFATYTWLKTALVEAGLGACARDLEVYDFFVKNPNSN
jgi:hypothetical protein